MLYSFVNTQGMIIGQPREFEDLPPELPAQKGKWLLDQAPEYDNLLYTRTRVEPVPSDATAISYVLTPVSLAEAQTVARNVVNKNRWQAINEGFTYQGKLIDTYHDAPLNIIGAAVAAQIAVAQGLPFNVTWTCADNTTLELDAQGVLGMMLAFAQHVDTKHTEAREHKRAIDQAVEANFKVDQVVAAATTKPSRPR